MLYLVTTPIGNLGDMSPRALEILKNVPTIFVEKWSDSIKLLNHFEIRGKRLISYDERNRRSATARAIGILEKGEDAAFITSGGAPGVSDPGNDLVRVCHEKNIPVSPIPGPSALSTAMSVSGLDGPVLFTGFLPKKTGELTRLCENCAANRYNLACFESPYRLQKTLEFINQKYPDLPVFVGREMTKKFEGYRLAQASEHIKELPSGKAAAKGEFTLIMGFHSLPKPKKV